MYIKTLKRRIGHQMAAIYQKEDCFRNTPISKRWNFISCHFYGYGKPLLNLRDKNTKKQVPLILSVSAASCAAERGHFECLQYIHERENGYWDEMTVIGAAGGNHFICLRYLLNEKCPWDQHVCRKLLNNCTIWITGDKTMTACRRCQKT